VLAGLCQAESCIANGLRHDTKLPHLDTSHSAGGPIADLMYFSFVNLESADSRRSTTNELNVTIPGFEIQTELLPESGKDRTREAIGCWSDVRFFGTRSAAIRNVAQGEIVLATESGSVKKFLTCHLR
jgi:hypothetical protein